MISSRLLALLFCSLLATATLIGCGSEGASSESQVRGEVPANASAASGVLRLATTTSTRDSGLLDQLLPIFEQKQNCRVHVVAKGTGAALKLGESGDADVLLVHARDAENEFMDAGHGIRHQEFMHNYFAVLGPSDDPAKIRGTTAADSLRKLAQAGEHPFLSRGDDSGTHKRELALWKEIGVTPTWDEYLETGRGMGPTLDMADQKQGYVLSDMGTYLKFQDKVDLVPLTLKSSDLKNPYAAIVVNGEKDSRINTELADALVDFLISAEAQRIIGEYEISGEQLFAPVLSLGQP